MREEQAGPPDRARGQGAALDDGLDRPRSSDGRRRAAEGGRATFRPSRLDASPTSAPDRRRRPSPRPTAAPPGRVAPSTPSSPRRRGPPTAAPAGVDPQPQGWSQQPRSRSSPALGLPAPAPREPDNGAAVAGFILSLVGGGLLLLSAGLSSLVSVVCASLGIFYSREGPQAGRPRRDAQAPRPRPGRFHHRDRLPRARRAGHAGLRRPDPGPVRSPTTSSRRTSSATRMRAARAPRSSSRPGGAALAGARSQSLHLLSERSRTMCSRRRDWRLRGGAQTTGERRAHRRAPGHPAT